MYEDNIVKKCKKVKVTYLFPIKEKECFYANLESFDWDFNNFGGVYLCTESNKILMRYTAFGNVNGTPSLQIYPADEKYSTVEAICELLESDCLEEIFIERV